MQKLIEKWKSSRGATMIMALALLAVVSVVSFVVISFSGTTGQTTLRESKFKYTQGELSITLGEDPIRMPYGDALRDYLGSMSVAAFTPDGEEVEIDSNELSYKYKYKKVGSIGISKEIDEAEFSKLTVEKYSVTVTVSSDGYEPDDLTFTLVVEQSGGLAVDLINGVNTYTHTYDGTNWLPASPVQITNGGAAIPDTTTITTTVKDASGTTVTSYKDAGTYTVTVKAEDPNLGTAENSYTIQVDKCPITLTSADSSKVYDGTPLTGKEADISVTSGSWVSGDEPTYSFSNSVTNVADEEKDNVFSCTFSSDTIKNNYTVTPVYGKLSITPYADKVTVTINGNTDDTKTYNGEEQSASDYTWEATGDNGLYTDSDFTFSGTAEAKGTDAGTYYMRLDTQIGQFRNVSSNFNNVEFVLGSDGYVTIGPNHTKIKVTVSAKTVSLYYDGLEHEVGGYTISVPEGYEDIITLDQVVLADGYTESDITVMATDAYKPDTVNYSAVSVKEGDSSGTKYTRYYSKELTSDMFECTNENYDEVTFDIGEKNRVYLTIKKRVLTLVDGYINSSEELKGSYSADYSGSQITKGGSYGKGWYVASSSTVSKQLVTGHSIDADNSTLTCTVTGINVNWTSAGTLGTYVGEFDDGTVVIKNGDEDVSGNYQINQKPNGLLTIKPKKVEMTSASANENYDGEPLVKHEMSKLTGFISGEGVDIEYTGTITDVLLDEAGEVTSVPNTYTCKAKSGTSTNISVDSEGKCQGNYYTSRSKPEGSDSYVYYFVPSYGTLTVTQRPGVVVTITGNHVSIPYDGKTHDVKDYSIDINDSLYKESYFTRDASAVTTASRENVGTDSMALVGKFSNNNTNFKDVTFNVTNGFVEITQYTTPITVKVTGPASDTYTYNGSKRTLKLSDCSYTVTGNGSIDKDVIWNALTYGSGESAVSLKDYTIKGTNVGDYTLTVDQIGRTQQSKENIQTVNFDVSGVKLSITKEAASRLGLTTPDSYSEKYDGASHGGAAYCTVSSGTNITYSTSTDNSSWSEYSGTAPTITDVGKIYVRVKAENPNYETAEDDYTLEVTKSSITLGLSTKNKVYDATTLVYEGLATGSGCPVTVTSGSWASVDAGKVYYTVTTEKKDVSTTKATITVSGITTGNYTINGTTVSGYEINKRAITLKSATETETYSATVKSLPTEAGKSVQSYLTADSSKPGFVGTDGATYTYTTTVIKVGQSTKNEFSYTLNSGTSAGNYTITREYGDLLLQMSKLAAEDSYNLVVAQYRKELEKYVKDTPYEDASGLSWSYYEDNDELSTKKYNGTEYRITSYTGSCNSKTYYGVKTDTLNSAAGVVSGHTESTSGTTFMSTFHEAIQGYIGYIKGTSNQKRYTKELTIDKITDGSTVTTLPVSMKVSINARYDQRTNRDYINATFSLENSEYNTTYGGSFSAVNYYMRYNEEAITKDLGSITFNQLQVKNDNIKSVLSTTTTFQVTAETSEITKIYFVAN